jgi:hypothetical protein
MKKIIMSVALAVLTAASAMAWEPGSESLDTFYVYRNDAPPEEFDNSKVDSVVCSLIDTAGVAHAEYVSQEIWQNGKPYRIPLSAIDSIAFHHPYYEAVDLGLSVKWATFNVGAHYPEERRIDNLYGWGDPTGRHHESCQYESAYFGWTKVQIHNLAYAKYYGCSADTMVTHISGTSLDIAKVKWGGKWRMPTAQEFIDLFTKCKWTYEMRYDSLRAVNVDGYKVEGPNGNSIYLTVGIGRVGNVHWINTDVHSSDLPSGYWTGDRCGPTSYGARCLFLEWGNPQPFIKGKDCYYKVFDKLYVWFGLFVRPVMDK